MTENQNMENKVVNLEDSQLEKVSGGGVSTLMICKNCNKTILWAGDYLTGIYECPYCHVEALRCHHREYD